jgi:hypothetical protein
MWGTRRNGFAVGEIVTIAENGFGYHPRFRGQIVGFRDGGRTALIQSEYAWRRQRIPVQYLLPRR